MIPEKIKNAIENSSLSRLLDSQKEGKDWGLFTRTVFSRLAKGINGYVTQKVIQSPYLVGDMMLLGREELDNLYFKNKLNNLDDFVHYLESLDGYSPHCWISGKTLQSYWNGGNAKDKKLNVLLAYLDVPTSEWDDWKRSSPSQGQSAGKLSKNRQKILKQYFQGFYYRYFQKTDGSPVLVKAPWWIKEVPNLGVVAFTKTTGHAYRSTSMAILGGALYVDCENTDWDERESHVFNIGYEIQPSLIVGVSNTINRRGRAMAVKNVLVRQAETFDYEQTEAVEIPYDQILSNDTEEALVMSFFRQSGHNLMVTPLVHGFEELDS